MNGKYSNFLTILLILIIIAIVGIIGFLGFKYYQTYIAKNESEDFVDAFVGELDNNTEPSGTPGTGSTIIPEENETEPNEEIEFDGIEQGANQEGTANGTQKKFNGFIVSGTIEIPATNLKCPILAQSEYSTKALDTSVVELYGAGLNKVGVTTIAGHNYRNGAFFSNNKKLNVGDKIFITGLDGKRLSYTIYDKFEAEENATDFMIKDTQGAIEIALQTCTDDSKGRIIILAKADV